MKEKFQLEYVLGHASTSVLWQSISTTHGLEGWFADSVTVKGSDYTFVWDDTPQEAVLKNSRISVYMRFHWKEDEDAKTFFELRISVNELTQDVILTVTDFAEPEDKDDAVELWNMDIDNLRKMLGI